jgi:hypothetical protein
MQSFSPIIDIFYSAEALMQQSITFFKTLATTVLHPAFRQGRTES